MVDSSKSAKLVVMQVYVSPNQFLNFTLAVLRASGVQPLTQICLSCILLVLVSTFPISACLLENLKYEGLIYLFLSTESKSAQRVFKVGMKFPTSVLCNEAGQGVLRQKVRTSINALNREWNFCSNSLKGNFQFLGLLINVLENAIYPMLTFATQAQESAKI